MIRPAIVGVGLCLAAAAQADVVVYRMSGPTLPAPRSANGYSVTVNDAVDGSAEVRVETLLNPIGAHGSYADVLARGRREVPDGFRLPPRLRSELFPELDAWEAATVILRWVSRNLKLIDGDRRPQDAQSVLRNRGGRCSGLANATAALMLGAGFNARTVSGLLVTKRRTIPHRWVEVELPGAGWVATDPTLGQWVITARHVAFADAVTTVPEVSIIDATEGELSGLPRSGGTMIRPNVGAALVCRLSADIAGRRVSAMLTRGSDIRRGMLGREVRFGDLLPGRWLLEIDVDGHIVERRALVLKAGQVHSYVVKLPSPPAQEVGS